MKKICVLVKKIFQFGGVLFSRRDLFLAKSDLASTISSNTMVYLFFKLYLEFGWPDDYISDFLNINEMMQREFEDCLKFASALDYKLWIYYYLSLYFIDFWIIYFTHNFRQRQIPIHKRWIIYFFVLKKPTNKHSCLVYIKTKVISKLQLSYNTKCV